MMSSMISRTIPHLNKKILRTPSTPRISTTLRYYRSTVLTQLSSSSGSSLFSIFSGSDDKSSSSSPPTDQYAKQLYNLSRAGSWTLGSFSQHMKDSSGGWKAKLPFLNQSDQVKYMKRMQELVDAMIEVVGSDADANKLKDIGKKEKLMICLKCKETNFQEINSLITQFQSMDTMYRVLRYRVENNLQIPESEEETKRVMQTDLKKVLSQSEIKAIQRSRMKSKKR